MSQRRITTSLAWLLLACGAIAAEPKGGTIGEGKDWATAYYVQEAKQAGPTVLVLGGIHGDEPAGVRAAEEIARWPVVRGKLVVIPCANQPARKKRSRLIPDVEEGNLNRNFPQKKGDAPKGELATALWEFVSKTRPDWLLDLHEAIGVRQQLKLGTGSTIIHDAKRSTRLQAERMLDAVNATIEAEASKFVLLRGPIQGSIACSAADLLGARAMILEATCTFQPLELRVRQHQTMVARLLRELGMLPKDFDVPPLR